MVLSSWSVPSARPAWARSPRNWQGSEEQMETCVLRPELGAGMIAALWQPLSQIARPAQIQRKGTETPPAETAAESHARVWFRRGRVSISVETAFCGAHVSEPEQPLLPLTYRVTLSHEGKGCGASAWPCGWFLLPGLCVCSGSVLPLTSCLQPWGRNEGKCADVRGRRSRLSP